MLDIGGQARARVMHVKEATYRKYIVAVAALMCKTFEGLALKILVLRPLSLRHSVLGHSLPKSL